MDDDMIRVSVGLCLGAPVCGLRRCQQSSAKVNAIRRHALSYRRSEGRHLQHAALNEIVKGGLTVAQVPSRLEPTGLLRSDENLSYTHVYTIITFCVSPQLA